MRVMITSVQKCNKKIKIRNQYSFTKNQHKNPSVVLPLPISSTKKAYISQPTFLFSHSITKHFFFIQKARTFFIKFPRTNFKKFLREIQSKKYCHVLFLPLPRFFAIKFETIQICRFLFGSNGNVSIV